MRALGRGCCNEVDDGERRGGGRNGIRAGRRMTRKGKEGKKVGVEGREYLIQSQESESKVSLTHIIGWQRPQWAIKPTMGWIRPGRRQKRWESGCPRALRRCAQRRTRCFAKLLHVCTAFSSPFGKASSSTRPRLAGVKCGSGGWVADFQLLRDRRRRD